MIFLLIKTIRLKGLFSTTCMLPYSKSDSYNIRKISNPKPQIPDWNPTFWAFLSMKISKIECDSLVPMISTFHTKHRKRTHLCVLATIEMDFGTYPSPWCQDHTNWFPPCEARSFMGIQTFHNKNVLKSQETYGNVWLIFGDVVSLHRGSRENHFQKVPWNGAEKISHHETTKPEHIPMITRTHREASCVNPDGRTIPLPRNQNGYPIAKWRVWFFLKPSTL